MERRSESAYSSLETIFKTTPLNLKALDISLDLSEIADVFGNQQFWKDLNLQIKETTAWSSKAKDSDVENRLILLSYLREDKDKFLQDLLQPLFDDPSPDFRSRVFITAEYFQLMIVWRKRMINREV